MKKTTHLELNKPELTDYVNVEDLNENADIIDEAINENKERLATHLAERASLTEVGHVQLSDDTNSENTTFAVTPNAVRKAVEQNSFTLIKSNKDAEGIFTTVEHRRKSDNMLVRKSVLSGGTSPRYTTRTITYYKKDGVTVEKTDTFTLSYDADGDFISEV